MVVAQRVVEGVQTSLRPLFTAEGAEWLNDAPSVSRLIAQVRVELGRAVRLWEMCTPTWTALGPRRQLPVVHC